MALFCYFCSSFENQICTFVGALSYWPQFKQISQMNPLRDTSNVSWLKKSLPKKSRILIEEIQNKINSVKQVSLNSVTPQNYQK